MSIILSERLSRVGASPTLAISAKAAKLKREGRNIVAFGAGEPDFDTPQFIKDAADKATAEGKTKYSAPAGIIELREALVARYSNMFGLDYTADQALVSCGAKHTLYNLFTALLNEGDEVIIPAPYWVSYPAQTLLAGGKPVFVDTDPNEAFCPTPEALSAAVTDKTRAV
ncbi:MAG: aminotransferase class I/II-fold pyridoxal phosphate-dependent enzyme, partial [Myxococcales bacterium]|nr:aminotransferase class I/II-fold pyridoxal phosphate-dependent enzyme [Myxococcales bacterium]